MTLSTEVINRQLIDVVCFCKSCTVAYSCATCLISPCVLLFSKLLKKIWIWIQYFTRNWKKGFQVITKILTTSWNLCLPLLPNIMSTWVSQCLTREKLSARPHWPSILYYYIHCLLKSKKKLYDKQEMKSGFCSFKWVHLTILVPIY